MIPLWLAWLATALACFRAQRIVTTDDWPPSAWFRRKLVNASATGSRRKRWFWRETYAMFTCPWCFGTWVTVAGTILTHVFVLDLMTGEVYSRKGFVALLLTAAAGVVGLLGSVDGKLNG